MLKLQKHSRVCCLGDSWTDHHWWLYEVMSYLSQNDKENEICFFNCGLGGNGADDAKYRLEDNVLYYAPTHVIVHFGYNEICGRISDNPTNEELAEYEQRYKLYRESYIQIINKVRELNIIPVLFTASIYDDMPHFDTDIKKTAPKHLDRCADIVKEIAKEYDCDVIDVHEKMLEVKNHWDANGDLMFAPDRVHPNKDGYFVLGRVILKELGYDVVVPKSLKELKENAFEDTTANQLRLAQEYRVVNILRIRYQNLWKRHAISYSDNVKKLLQEYVNPDTGKWYKDSIEDYFMYNHRFDEMRNMLIQRTKDMY